MFGIEDISQKLLNRLFSSNVLPRIRLLRKDTFSSDFTTEELAEIMREAGFDQVTFQRRFFGAAAIHQAVRPE